jgi:DUF1680 family protein
MDPARRRFLKAVAPGILAATGPSRALAAALEERPASAASPFPLEAVRLDPSPFLDAVEANKGYLHRIEPDRLLHNFRRHAGLAPKADAYGGWEADTIAGHTLGHYLSACALMVAQTGDPECRRRVDYIVGQLALCQAGAGDGYVAGFTRTRGTIVEDGRALFAELERGDIRSAGFDLNGCWVPFYNWHKLYAGLFDADRQCGNRQAIDIARRLGGYIEHVFAALDDGQVQQILECEHGGINESFAELYARTGERRWLTLARRLRHRRVLDPLAAGRDELPNLHSNTQIPKVIGLARLHELTRDPADAAAARFFWDTVVTGQSYVIGGNGDREYFQASRAISRHITEQTCEACATYNMLKLTRHLYAWRQDAVYFDYYERAHLNHILAQQNPGTGMLTYMTPLLAGAAREFSTPFDDFWCCVGTGMESHAKHGDSIYWHSRGRLIVNLFIPSRLAWRARGAEIHLATDYPLAGSIRLTIAKLDRPSSFELALRVPAWCERPTLALNGARIDGAREAGYLVLRRRWRAGDAVTLDLPMPLRLEPTPDDPTVVAVLSGPLVLAADLGPADAPYAGPAPALVGEDLPSDFSPVQGQPQSFRTGGSARPTDLSFKPFYAQYDRRSAVYLRRFDDAEWEQARATLADEEIRRAALDARSVDIMPLGEVSAERDHGLKAENSYPVVYRGRNGRDARSGGFFEFTLRTRPGPLLLRATYWGEERRRLFRILIDGTAIATERLDGDGPGEFVDRDYPLAASLTRDKERFTVRFEPEPGHSAGPVFGCHLLGAIVP